MSSGQKLAVCVAVGFAALWLLQAHYQQQARNELRMELEETCRADGYWYEITGRHKDGSPRGTFLLCKPTLPATIGRLIEAEVE